MKSFLKRFALLSGRLGIHLAPFISSYIGTQRSVHELFTLQGCWALKEPARLGRASP